MASISLYKHQLIRGHNILIRKAVTQLSFLAVVMLITALYWLMLVSAFISLSKCMYMSWLLCSL